MDKPDEICPIDYEKELGELIDENARLKAQINYLLETIDHAQSNETNVDLCPAFLPNDWDWGPDCRNCMDCWRNALEEYVQLTVR